MRFGKSAFMVLLLAGLFLSTSSRIEAQVNTVNLSGTVFDPQQLIVKDAKITLRNTANGAEREATSDSNGRYEIIGIPPGIYSLTVQAPGFAAMKDESLKLALGTTPEYNPHLQLKTTNETISVVASPDLVETTKTDVSTTISQTQIDNLPINGRNYINFTLLNSQAARDDTPSIGAAPTSGLNFGGQRARSNEVSVDGADAVDNSVNGVRATVSQEAVQEFQVITSNYMPEYGRAMGGVVNIVTKSGSNQVHGDVFGFLRNGAIQARNPFSVKVVPDESTGFEAITPPMLSTSMPGMKSVSTLPPVGAAVSHASPRAISKNPVTKGALMPNWRTIAAENTSVKTAMVRTGRMSAHAIPITVCL